MNCKQGFIKLFAVLLVGFVALNISLAKMDDDLTQHAVYEKSYSVLENYSPVTPSAGLLNSIEISETTSSPMAYLFQLLFILFLISPPLIVIYLCLIWKELKKRNELK